MKRVLLTGCLLLLEACHQSPDQAYIKSLKTSRSWLATAHLIGEQWQQGYIPDTYAEQALEKSQQAIDQATQDLPDPPAFLRRVQRSLKQVNQDVKQRNRDKIAAALQQLADGQQQLDSFLKLKEKQDE